MTRKESKIPLVVTILILAYFVFWAIGYVRRNKPAPPAEQPTTLAKAAEINDVPPKPVAEQTSTFVPATPQPEQPATRVAPVQGSDADVESVSSPDDDVIGGKHIQNRKLLGIAKEATNRH